MLKSLVKRTPFIDGSPITFTHEEGACFWKNGKFDVSSLHRKMAEKALIVLLRYSDEIYTDNPFRHLRLKSSSVEKAPRRFWGKCPIGYHIIRLCVVGYGNQEKSILFRFVRSSEENFNGYLFNHPSRSSCTK